MVIMDSLILNLILTDRLTQREQKLIKAVVFLEGRMPGADEIAYFWRHVIHPDGIRFWFWKNIEIYVEYPPLSSHESTWPRAS